MIRPSLQPMELKMMDVSAVKPDEVLTCQDDIVIDGGLSVPKNTNGVFGTQNDGPWKR